ncbi:oxygen sensor histidine kinase NreB [Candidatus Thiodiazotropha endolucinida]|uniref:histidine kinase n=2 Tax=Candidatus Thiodiazotropha endolucinida TaxID=1655433 RepID=A0A7Z0VN46_9GAMM|nr:oxygen sensor histidine kinase NreB [Candidatus Thiodiazotropha endolucinida]
MTLVKDKNLQSVGQSLLTLTASSITPGTPSSNTSSSKSDMSSIDQRHIAGVSELLDFAQFQKNRMSVEEEEKKRISRELHDGLGQLLTSMNLHIQRCLDGCNDQNVEDMLYDKHIESLNALSSMVKLAIDEIRTICSTIRPAILDDLGVNAAITWQCRQISQISTDFDVVAELSIDESEIPEELKTVIYRIVQESLNNALKYSRAKQVKVSLWHTRNAIQLTVEDDGVGFDPVGIKDRLGMGLMSMRERAESASGTLQVNAEVGQGVKICGSFPAKKITLNG